MAEKMKDAEDLFLESLFESPPIADDGFSASVVKKVNRQVWLRRLALPVAAVVGGLIAFKPLAAAATALSNLTFLIPEEFVSGAASSIPQLQTIILGAVLLVVGLVSTRMLEQ